MPGITNWGVKLSTVELLIKLTCFLKVRNIFSIKTFWSKLVSKRRCTESSPSVRHPCIIKCTNYQWNHAPRLCSKIIIINRLTLGFLGRGYLIEETCLYEVLFCSRPDCSRCRILRQWKQGSSSHFGKESQHTWHGKKYGHLLTLK